MFAYECTPGAPVHMCIGMGGRDNNPYWLPIPNWSMHRDSRYGWVMLHFVNSTALHVQFNVNEAGGVVDEAWITK